MRPWRRPWTPAQLAGAALDVQDPEPPDLAQPPWNDPRVIVTPHAAFVSEESLANLRTRTARQVADLPDRRPAGERGQSKRARYRRAPG